MDKTQIQVLHVDDEPAFTDLTATFLEREDEQLSVETADSAADGVALVDDPPPDCIVSDFNMPGMDGLEFLRAVREDYPELPFILYTGEGSEAVASEAIAAGVTDYLQKQTGTEQYELLVNRIRNAVQARRESARADRQDQLMRLTECAGDTGGFELETETGAVMLTDGCRRILGLSEQASPTLEEHFQQYHPDDRAHVQQTVQQALQTGTQTQGTWRYQQPAGAEKLLNVTYMPAAASGDATTVRGAVHDITDHQQRQRSLEQSKTVVDVLTDAVYVVDEHGRFSYVNDEFVELVGYDRDTVLGNTPSLIKDAESVERAERQLGRLLSSSGPETVNFEVTLQPRDGDPIECQDHMGVLPSDGARSNGSVGVLRDITELKKNKQQAEQLESVATQLTELASELLRATGTAVDEKIDDSLQQIGELVGADRSYVFAVSHGDETITNTHEWTDRGVTPQIDDLQQIPFDALPWWMEQLQGNESIHVRRVPDLPPAAAATQRLLEEQDIHSVVASPMIAEGELTGFVGFDWTETQSAWSAEFLHLLRTTGELIASALEEASQRRELRRERQRFQTLFTRLSQPAVEVEYDGLEPTVTDVNPAFEASFGYDAATITGESLDTYIIPDDDRDEAAEINAHASEGGQITSREVTRQTADGPREYLLENAVTKDGTRGFAVYTRFTGQKQRRQELRRERNRLEEFAGIVSHDLRNPLNAAGGRIELAHDDCESPHLRAAADAIDRSQALVDDLLTLAREGETVADPEPVALAEMTQQCWQGIQTERATLEGSPDRVIEADRSRLRELLENLYRNAVEHGGETVTVQVGAMDDGFYVADTGSGVSESDREQIFEPGYSTNDDGTGFGLRIIKQIADAHGWTVAVTESEHGGARFEITNVEQSA